MEGCEGKGSRGRGQGLKRRWGQGKRLRGKRVGCILTWVSEVLPLPLVSGEVSTWEKPPAPVGKGSE